MAVELLVKNGCDQLLNQSGTQTGVIHVAKIHISDFLNNELSVVLTQSLHLSSKVTVHPFAQTNELRDCGGSKVK